MCDEGGLGEESGGERVREVMDLLVGVKREERV